MAFLKKVLRPGQKPGEAPASSSASPSPVPRPVGSYEDEPLSECVEHIKTQKISAKDAIDDFDILLIILAADFKNRPELYKPIKAISRARARSKRNSGVIGTTIVANPDRMLTRTASSDAIRQSSEKLVDQYPLDDDSDDEPLAPVLSRREHRAQEIEMMKEEWRRKMRGEMTEEERLKEEWKKKMRGELTEEERMKEEWRRKMRGEEATGDVASANARVPPMTEAERVKEEWRRKMRGEEPALAHAPVTDTAVVAADLAAAAPRKEDSKSLVASDHQRKPSTEPRSAPTAIAPSSAEATPPATSSSATTPSASPRPRPAAQSPADAQSSEQSAEAKEKKRRKQEKKERKRAQREAVIAAAATAPAPTATLTATVAEAAPASAIADASATATAPAPAPAPAHNAMVVEQAAPVVRSASPFSKRDTIRSHKPIVEQLVDLCKRDDPTKYYGDRCRIGKGGFGEVFLATDLRLKRGAKESLVAIKVSKERYNSGFQGELIANEILLLASCRHKNIVNFLEAYIFKDRVWTVMEYCDGGTLTELYKGVELGEPHFSFITKEILVGLAYLHSLNRLHRDIKGENILLNMDGDIKIADLGLAAEADEKGVGLVGSRYWMSPEMIRREGYDHKTDIWSTGCVLIEMCNREPPYHEYRSTKALFKIATRGAAPLKHAEAFSKELKSFLARATKSRPEERPSTDELLKHPWIVNAGTKSDMMKATEVVFLGNSLRMNGF